MATLFQMLGMMSVFIGRLMKVVSMNGAISSGHKAFGVLVMQRALLISSGVKENFLIDYVLGFGVGGKLAVQLQALFGVFPLKALKCSKDAFGAENQLSWNAVAALFKT